MTIWAVERLPAVLAKLASSVKFDEIFDCRAYVSFFTAKLSQLKLFKKKKKKRQALDPKIIIKVGFTITRTLVELDDGLHYWDFTTEIQ